MPADGVLERSERDGVDYATWRDQKWITATPGPVVDVAHVAAAIAELAEELDVQGVVGDAYRRPELQAELEELGVHGAADRPPARLSQSGRIGALDAGFGRSDRERHPRA